MDTDDEDILVVVMFVAALMVYNGCRNRTFLTRSALVSPTQSPWMHLMNHGDQQSFLELTGFTRHASVELETVLFDQPMMDRKRGRPTFLDDRGQLGLYLFYLGSRMHMKHLCMIFGVTPSVCVHYLHRLMVLVVRRLRFHPYCRIKLPNAEEKAQYAAMVASREPAVRNCIGFVDGLALPTQWCSSIEEAQGAYFNGYHHDTTVNNVLAFAPTGKVMWAAVNFPGSWHDSTVCQELIAWAVLLLS